MRGPKRAVSALAVAAGVVVVAAWSCNQYVVGNRCGHRVHDFQAEPVMQLLPPESVEVGRASQRPHCGIEALRIRGFSELRLASAMSQEAVEAWYKEQFGERYRLSRFTEVGGISLRGTRRHSGHTFDVSVEVAPRTSAPSIFPADAHIETPDWAQTVIRVEVGDP
jgi:hypothetical protein